MRPIALIVLAACTDATTPTGTPTPTGDTGTTTTADTSTTPPPTGSVLVTAPTTGAQTDPDGYVVDVGADPHALALDGTLQVDDLPLGPVTVTLGDVAPNCDVADGASREVTVTEGPATEVDFDVTCVPAVGTDTLAYVAFDRDFDGYNPKTVSISKGTDGLLFEEHELYRNAGPALSPDGRWVAMSIADKSGVDRLWVMRVDGTDPVEIDAPAVHPSWSPDGSQLVYMYEDKDFWRMRTRDAQAKAKPFTVTSQNYAVHPQWSPQGHEILFVAGSSNIQAVTTDGQDYRTILRSEKDVWLGSTISLSPDGSALAYTRSDPKESDYDVHVMTLDGKSDLALTESDRYDEWPVWSPDGREVAFVRRAFTNVLEIWVTPADGVGKPRLVITEAGSTAIHGQGWGTVELP